MKKYLDAPLIAFVAVMVAAASITSHGTYRFYALILPAELALAATVVLTAGIPLLELAAVLDKEGRPRYIAGMVVLLAMEALAQYFDGQAWFLEKVRQQYPTAAGIDLATFAAESRGRLLPIMYLALLSIVVVYFGYAASKRIRDLRGVVVQATQVTQGPALHPTQRPPKPPAMITPLAEHYGFVYLLRGSNGTYKIGRTKSVEDRMRAIASDVPFDVELIHSIETPQMIALERDMHRVYEAAGKRVYGEWFALSDEDVAAFIGLGSFIPVEEIGDHVAKLARIAPRATPQALPVAAQKSIATSLPPTLSLLYRRIADLADENPTLDTKWLAQQLGRSERTAQLRRGEMVKLGLLHEEGGVFRRNAQTQQLEVQA